MEKKIVQLCKFGPNFSGGIETEAENIKSTFINEGFAVEMLHFSSEMDSPHKFISGSCRRIVCKTNFQFRRQPISYSYFKEVLKLKGDYIIHLHLPNYWGMFCCLWIINKSDIVIHWHSDVIGNNILKFILKPIERYILKRASAIICTSLTYARSSKSLGDFLDKVSVLQIATKYRNVALKKKHFKEKINILNVGRLVHYKNQNFLLEALSLLPDRYNLKIVGNGHLLEDLKKKAKKLKVSDRVSIVNQLTEEELEKEYKTADIFFLSSNSRAEAFGVVLIEALSFGLPIVALKIEGSGINEVNQHGYTGFNSLIGCRMGVVWNILQLTQNLEKYNKFRENALKHHADHFSFSSYQKKLLSIYSRMLEQ